MLTDPKVESVNYYAKKSVKLNEPNGLI